MKGLLWSLAFRLLGKTIRFRVEGLHRIRECLASGQNVILLCSHRDVTGLLLYATCGRHGLPLSSFVVLTSDGTDGHRLARVLARYGLEFVTRPGGDSPLSPERKSQARSFSVRRLVRMLESGGNVMMTADEKTRTEHSHTAMGAVTLAARTGRGIVLASARSSKELVLSTWDGHLVPLPFVQVTVLFRPVTAVPTIHAKSERGIAQAQLASELLRLSARASDLANSRQYSLQGFRVTAWRDAYKRINV